MIQMSRGLKVLRRKLSLILTASGEIHINSVLIVVCTAMLAVLILIAMAAIR